MGGSSSKEFMKFTVPDIDMLKGKAASVDSAIDVIDQIKALAEDMKIEMGGMDLDLLQPLTSQLSGLTDAIELVQRVFYVIINFDKEDNVKNTFLVMDDDMDSTLKPEQLEPLLDKLGIEENVKKGIITAANLLKVNVTYDFLKKKLDPEGYKKIRAEYDAKQAEKEKEEKKEKEEEKDKE